ncbi:MAG: CotH kinase family protein, partial [Alistipes sp.]|nr:CotH kinase family protein [Alistipes sp.]
MNLISNKTLSLRAMLVALFAGLAIFGIAGCSDGGDDAITPEPEPAPQPQDKTQVIVDVSTLEVPEGKTAELRFKIVPSTVDISSADGLNVRIVDATTKQDIKQIAFDKGDIVLEGAGRYTVTVSSTVTEEYRTTACVMVTSKQNKTYLSNPFVLRNTPMVSEISSIVFTREKNPELADDIEFYYDEELNSFHARIKQIAPGTVDHSKLIATFIAEGCKSVTVNGVEQKSGVTVNDFTQPLKYVFTSVKGEVIEYDVSVTNHFTNLPVVYVNTDGKTHISGDITSKSEWKNATISITGNDQYDGLEQTTLQIRARGNTTLGWPKKAFNMKFEKQVKMLGIKKHKRWVMIANYCDATMLRNETAYYASSLTSLKWAPHGDFVELVYNGTYVGTYWLCEHVRVDKNRVAITETPLNDTSAKNTGYLVEYDFHGGSTSKPYWTSYINTQQQTDWNNRGNSSVRYVTKYPDENDLSTEQYEYIKKWVRDWEVDIRDKLTTNPDTADEEYEKYITKYIEPVSFIDYWLIYEVCLNHE